MTFASGNRLTAAQLNAVESKINDLRTPLLNVIGTSTTASVGTAETVVVTFPAATFAAHTAYRITFQGIMRGSTSTSNTTFGFRDTNVAGTSRGGPSGINIAVINQNYWGNFDHYIANTGASAIVGRVLCVTLATTGGTTAINAGANSPYSFVVAACGLDTDWTQAVAL